MITKWTVSNFKSIAKETQVSLAPLTILAGPNSSGKSTLFQSILLVSQTLANKIDSQPVVLNGALARLGQFDDLLSYNGTSKQITIGWECFSLKDSELTDIRNIGCKFSFDADSTSSEPELSQFQPKLAFSQLSFLAAGGDGIEDKDERQTITLTRSQDGMAKVFDNKIPDFIKDQHRSSLEYDVAFDGDLTSHLKDPNESDEIIGCSLQHFLPYKLLSIYDYAEANTSLIINILVGNQVYRTDIPGSIQKIYLPQTVINLLQEKLGQKVPELFSKRIFKKEAIYFGKFFEHFSTKMSPEKLQVYYNQLKKWPTIGADLEKLFRADLMEDEPEYSFNRTPLPPEFKSASEYLQMYFTNSVKYLSSLRVEPKSIYQLETYAAPDDIGIHGEMTAAVLNRYSENVINYVPSAAFDKKPFMPFIEEGTLQEAVDDWLSYLSVAEAAHSLDKGDLGHKLKFSLSLD
ncbi:MAG: AAA family ATPase, partial [Deltaproteobacteria bacterium]|nr:AAA family ATPase [Deltaproteobacteria bacterium]